MFHGSKLENPTYQSWLRDNLMEIRKLSIFYVKVFKLLRSNLLKISSYQLWIHGIVLKVTKPWILLCKRVNGCTATSWKFQTINNVPQRSCCVLQSLSCAGYLVWGCLCSGASLAPACILHSRLWDCFCNCQKQVVVSRLQHGLLPSDADFSAETRVRVVRWRADICGATLRLPRDVRKLVSCHYSGEFSLLRNLVWTTKSGRSKDVVARRNVIRLICSEFCTQFQKSIFSAWADQSCFPVKQ